MRTRTALAAVVVALATVSAEALAQGNLSTQGFGYPPGQLSARGLATGGGVAEIDPQGAINPAALILWGANVLFGQYDPEFRSVQVGSARSGRTMTARFPGVGASFRFGDRVAGGINVSTYLDRTWVARFDRQQVVGLDTVTASNVLTSDGSITDLRLALAYGVTPSFSIGVGGHVFSGEHRVTHQQSFPDTVRFAGIVERSDISYAGLAGSLGFEARIRRIWQIAGSARFGGDISSETGDTKLTESRIPMRYGASVAYHGIQGATLSARAAFEEWSSLQSLGTSSMTAFDGWDYGAGADVSGPRLGRRLITVRAGARHRSLPFGAGGQKVNELSFSTGLGIPVSVDRATLDIAVARSTREPEGRIAGDGSTGTPAGDVRETAYTISFGIRVRP